MYEDQKISFFQRIKKPLGIALIFGCIFGGFFWYTKKTPTSPLSNIGQTLRSFNPFSSSGSSSLFPDNSSSETIPNQEEVPTPVTLKKTGLRKIVLSDVAGFTLISKEVSIQESSSSNENQDLLKELDSFTDSVYKTQEKQAQVLPIKKPSAFSTIKKPFVRYADKKTGTIYDILLVPEKEDDLTPIEITTLSIPGIEEALFSADGKNVFIRYSDEAEQIQTLRAKINEDTRTLENTQFLDIDLTSFIRTPSKQKAFGLKKTDTGSELYEYTFSGSRKKVGRFPFSDFTLESINETDILLSTRPSGYVAGYVYTYNTVSGVRKKILSSISGVSALVHPNQKNSIYSRGDTSSTKLFMYSPSSGSAFETQLSSFVDKCVWGVRSITAYCAVPEELPTGLYPDTWYKGLLSTRDTLYRVDTAGSQTQLLRASDISGQNLDIIDLSFNSDEKNLFFINKYDSSLWVYDFSE